MLASETLLQNRYRIVRQLGQGGMGTVFEAVDERLDTTVALKETLFLEERLRKQFEREARLLARLHHPALPRVSDHFVEDDRQVLVMQFIAGDDLAEMISRKRGPFPAEQVLTWADQLLDALDYLHTQDPQIIHRDIKPQNLKLTARGQIILLDFGLAKGQASEVSRVTTSASIFGYTPNYAPLEQIQGLGTDPRSDLYALAATLYHLMTGVKPPDALTRAAAMVNGLPDPLRPANEVNSAIAPAVAAVLERAMAQNRELRYPKAAAMRQDLRAIGEPATVSNRSEANTKLFPPSAPMVAAATQPHLRQATMQAGETTVVRAPSKKKHIAPWTVAATILLLIGSGLGAFYAYQRRNSSTSQTVSSPSSSENNPATVQSSESPTANTTLDTKPVEPNKKAEASNQPAVAAHATTKKNEKVAREKTAAENQANTNVDSQFTRPPEVTVEAHPERVVPEPDIRDVNPPEVTRHPRINRRADGGTARGAGGVTIRNLPNGTQLITAPDGTRVVVRPDGSRRVFRPGERINRRKMWP